MQSLKLVDQDLVFLNGDLLLIEGPEEIAQCCEIVLGTNKNEWFLNPDMGILFKSFLGKSLSEDDMRQQIRHGLFQESRIKTVDNIFFVVNKENRTQAISFSATNLEGEAIEGGVIIDA